MCVSIDAHFLLHLVAGERDFGQKLNVQHFMRLLRLWFISGGRQPKAAATAA
jgi:hypothetical protein